MARLFSALLPPEHALAELRTALTSVNVDELRWTPPRRWHVTLGFFGDDDDQQRRARWLARRVGGRQAPTLRLAGAGTFPGVLWLRVAAATDADAEALRKLAQAAGAGRRGFLAHLTVARWRVPGLDRDALVEPLREFTGSWFTPAEVLLMRSDPVPGGVDYTVLRRFPLTRQPSR